MLAGARQVGAKAVGNVSPIDEFSVTQGVSMPDVGQMQRFWPAWAQQRRQIQEQMLRSLDRSLDSQEQLILTVLQRSPSLAVPPAHTLDSLSNVEGHTDFRRTEDTDHLDRIHLDSDEESLGGLRTPCRVSNHSGSCFSNNNNRMGHHGNGSKPNKGFAWETTDTKEEGPPARTSTKDTAWSAMSSVTPTQAKAFSQGSRRFRRSNSVVSMVSEKTKEKKSKLLAQYLGRLTPTLAEQYLPEKALRTWAWWSGLKEPKRSGFICGMIHNKFFDVFVTLVIVANSIYTGYQANYEMEVLGTPEESGPGSDRWLEPLFLAVFSLEMMAKIYVHRQYTFCNEDMWWNMFDFFLVAMAAMNSFILAFVSSDRDTNVTFARSLRIFRMGKILRIFRAMRFLHELRVMVGSILGSFKSLMWSFVMLGLILFVFSLFFVQQMAVHLAESSGSPELQELQREYFGSVQQAMLTLSMCTTGGVDWEDSFELVRPLGTIYALAFVFYIVFFTFAVMNILTGMFVENAMALCKPDEEEAMQNLKNKEAKEREELKCILEIINTSNTGSLTLEEFVSAADNDAVAHALAALGMNIKDSSLFFSTLASTVQSEGEIIIDEFVDQAMNLRGPATSIDLHGLIDQMGLMRQAVADFHGQISDIQAEVAALPSYAAPCSPFSPYWPSADPAPPNLPAILPQAAGSPAGLAWPATASPTGVDHA